ncbi:MAG: hypothetical protein CMJ85_08595 [Planctomycetes bacterium]|nr:hypothetical protein [Planctomycetota bacterium]
MSEPGGPRLVSPMIWASGVGGHAHRVHRGGENGRVSFSGLASAVDILGTVAVRQVRVALFNVPALQGLPVAWQAIAGGEHPSNSQT